MSLRLATRLQLLHRPHLITPSAALEIAHRIRSYDPRAFERQAGPFAALRRKGLVERAKDSLTRALRGDDVARPQAMDDDDYVPPPPRGQAYTPLWMGEPDKRLDWGVSVKDGVAMMEIVGPLAERGEYVCGEWTEGYDTIAAAIAEADADPSARAIFIRFDTPGGVVADGLDDIAAMFQARAPEAKPVWAFCSMACSAGYWIASQCDRVVAPTAGLIGSIGAVMVHENWEGHLEKVGIEITSIEFPEGGQKTEGAFWKALSEQGRADLQAMIDHCGEAFLATVHKGRGALLPPDKARGLQARVFNASHADATRSAVALGLIDEVMSEREAFAALRDLVAPTQTISLAPASGSAAASAASRKPAAVAGPIKETTMKPARIGAALAKAGVTDPDLKARLTAALAEESSAKPKEKAEGEEEDDEEDDAPAAEGEGEEDKEEGSEAAAEGEGDEEKEGEEGASGKGGKAKGAKALTGKARIAAILDLPEAKGRDAQARKLALDTELSVEVCRGILATGGSTLGANMRDVSLSASGGKALTGDDAKRARAFQLAGRKQRIR